jgi:predicted DNA-binding transcriptional regulator AlpA
MCLYLIEKDLYSARARRGRYPVSRLTLLKMIERGEFPSPCWLSPNRKVWLVSELDAYDLRNAAKMRASTEARLRAA